MAGELAEMVDNMNLEDNGDTRGGENPSTDTGARPDSGGDAAKPNPEGEPAAEPTPDGAGADEAPDDAEGYTADELDAPEPDLTPTSTPDPNVSPELKYIYDNLPTLSVRGRTSAKGQAQTFNIKAAEQLPEGFEFATDKERALFTQAIAAQESRAQQLQSKYQQEQQRTQANQYAEQENTDIRNEISDLQREKLMPMFKYKPDDKRFESDDAVKAAQEVLEYMNEKNNAYAQAGRLYRISYRDAYDQMVRQLERDNTDKRQRGEDSQRRTVSRQLAGGASAPSNTAVKARPARSMQELMDRIEMME